MLKSFKNAINIKPTDNTFWEQVCKGYFSNSKDEEIKDHVTQNSSIINSVNRKELETKIFRESTQLIPSEKRECLRRLLVF